MFADVAETKLPAAGPAVMLGVAVVPLGGAASAGTPASGTPTRRPPTTTARDRGRLVAAMVGRL